MAELMQASTQNVSILWPAKTGAKIPTIDLPIQALVVTEQLQSDMNDDQASKENDPVKQGNQMRNQLILRRTKEKQRRKEEVHTHKSTSGFGGPCAVRRQAKQQQTKSSLAATIKRWPKVMREDVFQLQ